MSVVFRFLINGEKDALKPDQRGTKAAAHYVLDVPAGEKVSVKLRLCGDESVPTGEPLADFDSIFDSRLTEADEFYDGIFPQAMGTEERNVTRQAYAGKLTIFLHCL